MQTQLIQKAIYPTTANFPGTLLLASVDNAFIKEKSSTLNKKKIQICPQQVGQLTEGVVSRLNNKYRNTNFHLHANVNVLSQRFIFDASCDLGNEDVQVYVKKLKTINDLLGKHLYSYHGGRRVCSLEKMVDNAMQLQDYLDTEVVVEGLYPDRKNTWLISSLDEYEWLSNKTNFVLDLSHLQIVFEQEKKEIDVNWVRQMMEHKHCKEIHISSNDGEHDSHKVLSGEEWWIELLKNSTTTASIFTEENFK
jgi:hypothetical protein